MATISTLGTATFNTTSGTHTVVETPALGDLIIIITATTGSLSTTPPTDDNPDGLGTYTRILSPTKNTAADLLSFYIRNSLVGSNTLTTFTHAPGTTTGGGLAVMRAIGMAKAGTSAIRQSSLVENIAGGSTPTPVFNSAVLTGNPVIGAIFNATNPAGITPRSSPSYSEGIDTGYASPTFGIETMFIDSGETGTSIAWGSTSASAYGALVVEFDTALTFSVSDSTAVSDVDTIPPFFLPSSTSESSVVSDSISLVTLGDFSVNKNDVAVVSDSVSLSIPVLPTTLQVVLDGIGPNGFVPGIKIV